MHGRRPDERYETDDRGATWSHPTPLTGGNEIPGHIMQLSDGRLLLTFGVRHYPLGIQAMLTGPDGESWDAAGRLILACHGNVHRTASGRYRHSIGHPYTVALPDGWLLTAYYRLLDPFDAKSCAVEAVFWQVPGP